MRVCGIGHDDIAYEGNKCPLCEAIDDYEIIINNLNKKVDELETIVLNYEPEHLI